MVVERECDRGVAGGELATSRGASDFFGNGAPLSGGAIGLRFGLLRPATETDGRAPIAGRSGGPACLGLARHSEASGGFGTPCEAAKYWPPRCPIAIHCARRGIASRSGRETCQLAGQSIGQRGALPEHNWTGRAAMPRGSPCHHRVPSCTPAVLPRGFESHPEPAGTGARCVDSESSRDYPRVRLG